MSKRYRAFGNTGLKVSVLGFGAGHVGRDGQDEREVEQMLNRVLDAGITLIDTAVGYGQSEERIGKYIAHRRSEYVLSTKVGYGVEGYEDWTAEIITAGVDQALRRLKTDYLDIVHLHSCGLDVLKRGDVTEALVRAAEAGKVRVAAYSGENEELAYAIDSGAFGSIQTSVNICDQRGIDTYLPQAQAKGLGVIAKRPIANAPWRYEQRPVGEYVEQYWVRMQEMGLTNGDLPWDELALRFTAYQPGVHSCIVGTSSMDNLLRNWELIGNGPLPEKTEAYLRETFKKHDDNWIGLI